MALTLLLVRHGETVYNAENRYQGQRDIPLSDHGRDQARRLGERLAAAWEDPHARLPGPPVAAYASDLRRAAETAALAVAPFAATRGPFAVHSLTALRERNFGTWEGLTGEEIRTRFPGREGPDDAETWPEVWARMSEALGAIWRQHAAPAGASHPPVVLVVGHGGSLRAFVCRALGVGQEHIRRFRLDNASLSLLEFWGSSLEQSEGRVALLNDTGHLSGLERGL